MQFYPLCTFLGAVFSAHFCRLRFLYISILLPLIVISGGWYFFWSAPSAFPSPTTSISIPSGSSLRGVAATLEKQNVIRSAEVFMVLTKLFSDERGIQAGTYVFSKPYDVAAIVYRVTGGARDSVTVQITFIEGTTVREMADLLEEKLPSFDMALFLSENASYEGYLFPDTYRFMPTATASEVGILLRETFNQKTKVLEATIEESGHTFSDVVIMASLLEREARSLDEKRVIAGILWKRISNEMPLQVDAVFGYIKNKDTYHPSLEDLEIDSPYNTYRNKGLPPGPISNPGLESLLAAATPIQTSYLYYLTGKDDLMHYAKTFEEHKQNRAKYLD